MATGGLSTIHGDEFQIGVGKQSAWGTDVAPTQGWRWLDGTDANPAETENTEREGDTGGAESLVWKTGQSVPVKMVEAVRPRTLGTTLQAWCGTSSDTYTAPTFAASTLSASVAAGDTVFSTATNLGNVGTLGLNVDPGFATTTYEVVNVDLTTKSGGGPFTYTLASGGTFKKAHNSGVTITSASSHVFTRQMLTYDPYSIEYTFGRTGRSNQQCFRAQDAICYDLQIAGSAGQRLGISHSWYAADVQLKASPTALTYEGFNSVGVAGGPLSWYQGNVWKINGLTTGNAPSIRAFDITCHNTTQPMDLQNELLVADYYMPGDFDVSGSFTVAWQSYAQYYDTFFGSTSPATGTKSSYLIGLESLELRWASDAVNSFAVKLPQIYFKAPKLTPRHDGKPLYQQISFTAQKPRPGLSDTDTVILTLLNSQASAY